MRGRIDRRAFIVRRRVDSLIHQVRALARGPAALPVAFVCGMLAGRMNGSGIKRAYGFLAGLAGSARTLRIASSLIGSTIR